MPAEEQAQGSVVQSVEGRFKRTEEHIDQALRAPFVHLREPLAASPFLMGLPDHIPWNMEAPVLNSSPADRMYHRLDDRLVFIFPSSPVLFFYIICRVNFFFSSFFFPHY